MVAVAAFAGAGTFLDLSRPADAVWQALEGRIAARVVGHWQEWRTLWNAELNSRPELRGQSPRPPETFSLNPVYGRLPDVWVDRELGAIFPMPMSKPHEFSRRELINCWRDAERGRRLLIARWNVWRQLPASEQASGAPEITARHAQLEQALEGCAAQHRYLEAWQPDSRRRRVSAQGQDLLGLSDTEIASLREELRPHRILKRPFLPDTLRSGSVTKRQLTTLKVPLATDINDSEFRREFAGAVDSYWNQSPWARLNGVRFALVWHDVAADSDFARGKRTMAQHLSGFPKDEVGLTTGGQATGVIGNVLVLAPGSVNGRTLAHEFGHLLGFADCYYRTWRSTGWAGLRGTDVLEWNNSFFPDDLMCDNEIGVARAEVW